MTNRQLRIDHTAIVSLTTAVVYVLVWPFVDGWVLLLAATLSLVLGFLALSRIKRYGHSGRWLSLGAISLGAVFYVFFIVTVARDLIDPAQLQH
ncbi:DUF4190 domain-containing protein (plasmid) [Mycolicibacterium sp. ELW1]|uniref:DUF4190 domain-containing protein n=1 Tax=Mycobacteriaceae TaxID=1762 RepID=UPI0011EC46F2|nr:DUF4190 domain-containing protein [Mycobacterium sp. ELW1]QEN17695.1 DUF4190 domain-containing protein [Mycobacterium sp. ELW1]